MLSKPETLVCEAIGLPLTVASLFTMDASGYPGVRTGLYAVQVQAILDVERGNHLILQRPHGSQVPLRCVTYKFSKLELPRCERSGALEPGRGLGSRWDQREGICFP